MSRKKKPAKRKLLTCPSCGKGGFLNLKSHVCKKAAKPGKAARKVRLELVPPNESIEAIEEELTPVLQKVSRKTEDLLYDIVHVGLCLLKAQQVHRCNTCYTGSDGKFVESEEGGLRRWIEDKYPQISRMSAYRYITAATNCGLTHLDDFSVIEKLRAAHALKGKTAGELYRLPAAPNDDESSSPDEEKEPRWSIIRSAAVDLRERCEEIQKIRDLMSPEAFSTVCARLHATLESLTHQNWGVVEERPPEPFFCEHGDIYELGN